MYMLDTSMCIYAIKNKSHRLFQKILDTDPNKICISSITYAELLTGVRKSLYPERNGAGLNTWLSDFTILDFDQFAAGECSKVRGDLEKKGTRIGPLDMLLAGHALSETGRLVLAYENRQSNISQIDIVQVFTGYVF